MLKNICEILYPKKGLGINVGNINQSRGGKMYAV
jgi:hypothetical protein